MRLYVNKKVLESLIKGLNKNKIAKKCDISYFVLQNIIKGKTSTITQDLALKLQDVLNCDFHLFTDGFAIDSYSKPKNKNNCAIPCNVEMIKRVARVKGNDPELIADTIMKNKGIKDQTTFISKKQILENIKMLGLCEQ